jgi:hypothetical protein
MLLSSVPVKKSSPRRGRIFRASPQDLPGLAVDAESLLPLPQVPVSLSHVVEGFEFVPGFVELPLQVEGLRVGGERVIEVSQGFVGQSKVSEDSRLVAPVAEPAKDVEALPLAADCRLRGRLEKAQIAGRFRLVGALSETAPQLDRALIGLPGLVRSFRVPVDLSQQVQGLRFAVALLDLSPESQGR